MMSRFGLGLLTICALVNVTIAAQTRAEKPDLDLWQEAALAHEPGNVAPAARTVTEWPWSRLKRVMDQLPLRASSKTLFKAASMYLDVAVTVPVEQRPVYPTPLRGVYSRDGRNLGVNTPDTHLWLGRQLVMLALGRAGSSAAERDLAVVWLRAVNAVFARRLNFAELHPHLDEALKAVPEDPGLLFDAGCMSETMASPLLQATIWPGGGGASVRSGQGRKPPPGSRPALLAEAENRFRAVLKISPDDREARVRLGRALSGLGRNAEAVAELRSAQRLEGDRTVEYYNWLFLGDALTRSRQFEEALDALRQAAALFASAGAPHLAISMMYAEQGRAGDARKALDHLMAVSGEPETAPDPRWHYNRCIGRDTWGVYQRYVDHFGRELR